MKDSNIAVCAALMLIAGKASLFAATRLCGNGLPPQLTGDVFSPVECAMTTMPPPLLPGLPVRPCVDSKIPLSSLNGLWIGNIIHSLGRYQLLLTIKTSWTGKLTMTLDIKELQLHERLSHQLRLVPTKECGAYKATLTTTLAPEASLTGNALIGEASTQDPLSRQADLVFANGAAHRILFSVRGNDELSLRAYSAIAGAPLQKFEATLTRTQRKTL